MKKPYLITYDLNSPGQNYDEIISLLKGELSSAYCNYWKSAFLITSNYTPSQILDKLRPYLDRNDRMIIIEVVDNKSGWLTPKQWDWINKHIF
ncbi:hypothetical protein [Enterococcus faecium]|uniref:hypothetical protein n=1 Tax=Enterococcus faecium TaxID=1352 RepID=UPI0018A891D8|nr:hypothetical protein [Enterococcus faecium]